MKPALQLVIDPTHLIHIYVFDFSLKIKYIVSSMFICSKMLSILNNFRCKLFFNISIGLVAVCTGKERLNAMHCRCQLAKHFLRCLFFQRKKICSAFVFLVVLLPWLTDAHTYMYCTNAQTLTSSNMRTEECSLSWVCRPLKTRVNFNKDILIHYYSHHFFIRLWVLVFDRKARSCPENHRAGFVCTVAGHNRAKVCIGIKSIIIFFWEAS